MGILKVLIDSNLTTRELGEKIGLSGSQTSQIINEKSIITPMLSRLCRFLFWKELGIPAKEIIQELNLDEAPDGFNTKNRQSYSKKEYQDLEHQLEQMASERQILFETVKTLNRQLNNND